MKKEEIIERYGTEAYENMLQENYKWRENNPDKVKAKNKEISHKGGKYYKQHQDYYSTGIPYKRHLVRANHRRMWTPYKQIIAPDSQLHHEWIPETAKYRGLALVEKQPHQHGFIDIIQILEGEITLLTEGEIRNNEEMSE